MWFNCGDPIRHVRDFQRWKKGLKDSALTYRAHEILMAGLQEEKEPNPSQSFRPWECGDSLHRHYTMATQSQYKAVLKRLTGRNLILTTEIAVKTPITLTKRTRGARQEVSLTVPESGIVDGIPIERPQSTASAARQHYIATLYNIMLKEAVVRDGMDPAGAWAQ